MMKYLNRIIYVGLCVGVFSQAEAQVPDTYCKSGEGNVGDYVSSYLENIDGLNGSLNGKSEIVSAFRLTRDTTVLYVIKRGSIVDPTLERMAQMVRMTVAGSLPVVVCTKNLSDNLKLVVAVAQLRVDGRK